MNTIFIHLLKPLLYLLENYRWQIFGFIYLLGFGIYKFVCHARWLESAYYAASLFALNVKTDFPLAPQGVAFWLYLTGLLSAFYTIISVVSLVAKRFIDKQSVIETAKKPYILVCGLGKKASAYIDSDLLSNKNIKIIVIEKDAQNPNIQKYRSKGIAVKVADAKDVDVLKDLNLTHTKHIVVLAGKDTDNLEIALALREVFRRADLATKKLYVHINNRGLDKFYKDGGLLDDSAKLEVKMFSMPRNAAKALFLEHAVDGESRAYINSNKPFSLVVAGYSNLAIEVIGQICELAHLPNENEVTIYCVDKDIVTFKKIVDYRYRNIDKIPNIKLEYKALDYENKDFYAHEMWVDDITNIILCYEDAKTNLNIAAELSDSTYLQQIHDKPLQPKIHIAIYDSKMLAQNISDNEEYFKYFDAFAETSKMASKDMIVDEKFEMIAKCIHSGYVMRYNPDAMFSEDAEIEKAWNNTAKLIDRVSNRAQAYHIPMKLKALDLCFEESNMGVGERLLHNKEQFAKSMLQDDLAKLKLDKSSMLERTKELVGGNRWSTEGFSYFPTNYHTLMEKLLRAEHNRWNAHHWLKGWEQNDVKNSSTKQHDCLVPLANMPTVKRHTIIYDIYSVLYIPNLLAKAGYVIKPCESSDA